MRWKLLMGLLVLGVLMGDVVAKEYALRGKWPLAVLAVVLDAAGFACWVAALRSGAGLAVGSAIFSVASAAGAVMIGAWYYREAISATQCAGMVLGIAAVLLITWEG